MFPDFVVPSPRAPKQFLDPEPVISTTPGPFFQPGHPTFRTSPFAPDQPDTVRIPNPVHPHQDPFQFSTTTLRPFVPSPTIATSRPVVQDGFLPAVGLNSHPVHPIHQENPGHPFHPVHLDHPVHPIHSDHPVHPILEEQVHFGHPVVKTPSPVLVR